MVAAVIFCVANFILVSWIFYTLMQSFINRKIKLIYKYIYQTKASKKAETYYKYILPRKTIDEVSEDVEKWALQRREEIETLRHNEVFRKEFLQNLAHEFKTPIFAIQGSLDTLLDGADKDEFTRKKFLENASRNTIRLVNLLRDLDEISNLESGLLTMNKENFIIQDLIKEVFDDMPLKGFPSGITYSIKKGCEKPIQVYADKEKIYQVLTNLVENATRYGNAGGQVIASIYSTDTQHVLIEISDNGMGISEKHLPRLFERFYRTDRGRSRNLGGTGLGLAICKHIIEAHGQGIHVRSTEGVGTTIGFTLDAKKES
ncbi:MAG: sensor histidine kinase [Bacteroidetes bacterium]|nr:sensor histidine kinase [Bacteroidota bacterium]